MNTIYPQCKTLITRLRDIQLTFKCTIGFVQRFILHDFNKSNLCFYLKKTRIYNSYFMFKSDCVDVPLGMESGNIQNCQLSSSRSLDDTSAEDARLNGGSSECIYIL